MPQPSFEEVALIVKDIKAHREKKAKRIQCQWTAGRAVNDRRTRAGIVAGKVDVRPVPCCAVEAATSSSAGCSALNDYPGPAETAVAVAEPPFVPGFPAVPGVPVSLSTN